VFATAATAQRSRQDLEPRDGACFYENVNFAGNSFCVSAGERLEAVPRGMNDRVSSIRTFGRSEVTVYRDESFGGGSARFDDDVPDLGQSNWNDRVSSVQVRTNAYGRGGYSESRSPKGGASRIVHRAYRDVLGREPDAEGLRYYRGRIVDDGWTEAQVRQDLRRSDEYKTRASDDRAYGTSQSRADSIVRRAYQDVLGRDADAQGLRYYRGRILDEGWSAAQVRQDLRRSDEYKARTSDEGSSVGMTRARAQTIVRDAYRSVLNREPDPASEGYVEHVLRDGWSRADVERDLRRSAEYTNRSR
jgi:hypothetical protein